MDKIIERIYKNLDLNQKLNIPNNKKEFKDKIKNLIEESKNLTDIDNLNYRYLAGRLQIEEIYLNTLGYINTENPYENSYTYIKLRIQNNIYDSKLKEYSLDDLKILCKEINPKYDLLYDFAGAWLLKHRYLITGELPQEAYLAISMMLAINENNKVEKAIEYYHAIANHKISLATPILAGLRKPEANLASCFILKVEDNLDSIMEGAKEIAKISQAGGGVGINISNIRSLHSTVAGHENASNGVIPWIKIYNDVAVAVDQEGRRAGAVTVALDVWHYDILEFLELQTESGDQRFKAYDIFPQVVIPDEFMYAVNTNQDWYLFDPYEIKKVFEINLVELWGTKFENSYKFIIENLEKIKIYHKIPAKELYKKILQTQIETGMPYIAFKDSINEANPNKHYGYIPSVNLCCESFSVVESHKYSHCCNLLSLNLANLELKEIPKYTKLGIEILDNTIDLTEPPLKSTKEHNNMFRTVGLGAMGLADYLAKNNLNYTNLREISILFEEIAYNAVESSVNLAKEKGQYPAFKNSGWDKGYIINQAKDFQLSSLSQNLEKSNRWVKIKDKIKKYGIRNSQLLAIAPNTSSSLIQGCTASVLPAYNKFFINRGVGSAPVAPPYIQSFIYELNTEINQKNVIDAMSVIQQWVDTGISMELVINLNKNITAKDFSDLIYQAWQQGLKTIYYIRSIQKDDKLNSEEELKSNFCIPCSM